MVVVSIDGAMVAPERASISVLDRGLLYGDGCFEVLRTWDGVARDIEAHLDRLFETARFLTLKTIERPRLTEAIYRTLADPAYLDLSIDPDERPMGSLFAFPDPFDANYGRGGLARTMTARGWLSTWSGLSSHAKLADTMPNVTVPTLLVHPTADTEIRVWQAEEIVRNAGAEDVTYVPMKGAPHYLEGHRQDAMATVADWLAKRFP